MAYFLYEAWRNGPHRTVLHEGECVYCNEGEGLASDDAPDYAKWHGPFRTLVEARTRSKNLENIAEHEECGRCMKSKG
jgi:hypothetical protein